MADLNKPIEVCAFYFPNWHIDSRTQKHHGQGWTEWEVLKYATPRFEGHRQPIVPEWGYFDEADPAWMARQIDLAADHGITSFMFDWYYYSDGDFLERALHDGFLKAPNRERLKFALMWANHDWMDIQPVNHANQPRVLLPGNVNAEGFNRLMDAVIDRYFSQPNYLCFDGKPFFSIYDLNSFINGLGGLEQARDAMQQFDAKARVAGLPGVHFNAIVWQLPILPGVTQIKSPEQTLTAMGFSSATSYVWVHHASPDEHGFPVGSYRKSFESNLKVWEKQANTLPIPYAPNVTMGWDPSPRTVQSDKYENVGYPFTSILGGNTPAVFGEALAAAQRFVRTATNTFPMITINAWNEWTEGSYLLPDTVHKNAYLEQIRDRLRVI